MTQVSVKDVMDTLSSLDDDSHIKWCGKPTTAGKIREAVRGLSERDIVDAEKLVCQGVPQMTLTVGRIREAIKGLPDTAKVIVRIEGLEYVDEHGNVEDRVAESVEPNHAKATLTILV